MLSQLRRQDRQADQNRREARLRSRAGSQDDPPISPSYSWNGLKGLGLVETMTLFVSR
jgi:hypothetical protein